LSKRLGWILLASLPLGACDPGAQDPSLWFEARTLSDWEFANVSGTAEKDFVSDSFGAGVALRDFNGDGHLDIFAIGGGDAQGKANGDALFFGDGTGGFERAPKELSLEATAGGRAYGVNARDFDGDGDVDLYITRRGPNRLLCNRGDGTFEDQSEVSGLGDPAWSTGAAWLDFNGDGVLDLFVVNHIDFDRDAVNERGKSLYLGQNVYYGPTGLPAQADHLYLGQGDGTFELADVGPELGSNPHYGFGVIVFDEDQDGDLDLYVANDTTPNQLWRNDGGKGMSDQAARLGCALSMEGGPQAGMGVALGDADGDLQPELFITNFSNDYFTLYRRGEDGFWRDRTTRSRLHAPTWKSLGWACGFGDLDSDGDQDLWAFNGHVYPQMDAVPNGPRYAQVAQVFENDGSGRFSVPEHGGGPGMGTPRSGRGGAVGDLDHDGDLDMVMGVLDGSPVVLENTGRGGNSLMVELVGEGGNREAIGATVEGQVGSKIQKRWVGSQAGFLSSSDPRLHFGLGEGQQLDQLRILWPNGSRLDVGPLQAGQIHRIDQATGQVQSEPRDH